ncbi:MAG TPA: type II toxin-antitoxin system PemK/MazF family toxin [Microbacteriaceae bacterium]
MSSFTGILASIARAIFGTKRSADTGERPAPGRDGIGATTEVDPHSVGQLRMSYAPRKNGNPDPGEIVWTWVPYAERDGRGKDRPVLIVAAEASGSLLAVPLTSKDHDGDARDFVHLGTGPWDQRGRPSWVNIDRVFRVLPQGMRREAAALDSARFRTVADALRSRYGWGS